MANSLFQMGLFAKDSFRPLPLQIGSQLGQEIITSYDQTPYDPPTYTYSDPTYTYPDETTYTQPSWYPSGPDLTPTRQEPINPIAPQIPTTRPAGTSDVEWAKVLSNTLTAISKGYGSYSDTEIAKIKMEAEALRARNPAAAQAGGLGGISPTALFIGGAVLVTGVIALLALK